MAEEQVQNDIEDPAETLRHAEMLQEIRQQELEEYKQKLEAEYEPERQRIRKSSRDALESIEKRFGDQVRQWRKARGWSQEDLANELELLGFEMHQTNVGKIERGTRPLRVAEAVALAQIFRVPPLSVFYGAGPEDEPLSLESMRSLIENYEESINYSEQRLDDEAKNLAFWIRQRSILVDALNRAALNAEKNGPNG